PNGKVLVAGGTGDSSAELYDPATGTWTPTGALAHIYSGHSATMLPNGKVLVAGGIVGGPIYDSSRKTAELYNPTTGTWSSTGSLARDRSSHTATLLANGKVLVVGGDETAELYNPTTGTWSFTGSLATGRGGHTATLLLNGEVLA